MVTVLAGHLTQRSQVKFQPAGYLTSLVPILIHAHMQGREGKGSIYTFAAGNGGVGDTCAADGYTNSIYTISVGSAASNGRSSDFDEMCAGKMVVTFDSDPYEDTRHVVGVQDALIAHWLHCLFVCSFVCCHVCLFVVVMLPIRPLQMCRINVTMGLLELVPPLLSYPAC